jgi:hypothetical protein
VDGIGTEWEEWNEKWREVVVALYFFCNTRSIQDHKAGELVLGMNFMNIIFAARYLETLYHSPSLRTLLNVCHFDYLVGSVLLQNDVISLLLDQDYLGRGLRFSSSQNLPSVLVEWSQNTNFSSTQTHFC